MTDNKRKNASKIEGYEEFDPDFGRALRFALMDPKLAIGLTQEQRHLGQVIGNFMLKTGGPIKVGYARLAAATGLSEPQVYRNMIYLRRWNRLKANRVGTGKPYTYTVNISKAEALSEWLAAKEKERPQLSRSKRETSSEASQTNRETSIKPSQPNREGSTACSQGSAKTSEVSPSNREGLDAPAPETVTTNAETVTVRACPTLSSSSKLHAAGAFDSDSTVVSLSDDAEAIRRRLEPFGEHGHRWADECARFFKVPIPEAVGKMEMAALNHGHFNVVEAIREAAATSNVKSPNGLFGSILGRLLREHGKRDEIPETVAPQSAAYQQKPRTVGVFY